MPEQIDLSRVRATGVRDLKHYLEFALKGPRALVEQSLPTGREPDSPFETQVIKVLRNHGGAGRVGLAPAPGLVDRLVDQPRAGSGKDPGPLERGAGAQGRGGAGSGRG
ncbi:hypothetical protein G6F40_015582 [Rhizopus arrhizus]|nr:hypothetical protein G6F40_015582 [Rhizopus arrhizus]